MMTTLVLRCPLQRPPRRGHAPQATYLRKTHEKACSSEAWRIALKLIFDIGVSRHKPWASLIYGKSKVYFAKDCYGRTQQMGDKCDVIFSFKSKDPREVWEAWEALPRGCKN